MTLAFYVTIIVMSLLSFVVMGSVYFYRNRIPCMTGMMISMTLAMMVGLTTGVIFGFLYTGNLFMSTVLAMLTGLLIGFITGAPVSVMAVLDGMLAGIMGGMMGAMLGEMIAVDYRDILIKIMLVLFVGISFILLYMMQQELSRKFLFFHNPIVLALVIVLFFYGYTQLGPSFQLDVDNKPSEDHSQHTPKTIEKLNYKAETSPKAEERSEEHQVQKITIKAKEFQFIPGEIKVAKGQTIQLVLENAGEVEHDLEIVGLPVEVKNDATNTHANHANNNNNIVHLHTNKGEKQTVTFIPLKTGAYKIICSIPGHENAGMEGTLTVS